MVDVAAVEGPVVVAEVVVEEHRLYTVVVGAAVVEFVVRRLNKGLPESIQRHYRQSSVDWPMEVIRKTW